MGSELFATILEVPRGVEPDFDKAFAHVAALSDEQRAKSCRVAHDLEDDTEYGDEECRQLCVKAVEACRDGWVCERRDFAVVSGCFTNILVAGGDTWGDGIESVDAMALFYELGADIAAGFLDGRSGAEVYEANHARLVDALPKR